MFENECRNIFLNVLKWIQKHITECFKLNSETCYRMFEYKFRNILQNVLRQIILNFWIWILKHILLTVLIWIQKHIAEYLNRNSVECRVLARPYHEVCILDLSNNLCGGELQIHHLQQKERSRRTRTTQRCFTRNF